MNFRLALLLLCVFGNVSSNAETWIVLTPGGGRATTLEMVNPLDVPQKITLSLPVRGRVIRRTLTLQSGERRVIRDVAQTLFRSNAQDPITITTDHEVVLRTSAFRHESTQGLSTQIRFAPVADGDAISAGEALVIRGLAAGVSGTDSMVYLGEIAGRPVRVKLQIKNLAGIPLATREIEIAPLETRQISFESLSLPPASDLAAIVEVLSGNGRVVAAGAIENLSTGDGVARTAEVSLREQVTGSSLFRRRAARSTFPLHGRLELQVVMPIPAESRRGFLDNRAALEGNATAEGIHLQLAGDASEITFASFPREWIVKLGGSSATVNADGSFALETYAGGPTVAEVFSPAELVPLGTFSLADLTSSAAAPGLVRLRLPFSTPCFMNSPNTPLAGCHVALPNLLPASPTSAPSEQRLAKLALRIAPDHRTYPPTTNRDDVCKQLDGWTQADALLSYFGSTCFKRVWSGCCPDEGGWGLGATICCIKNHRGRLCQEVHEHDVEVLGDELIIIDLGETVKFTLHNNNCRGDSPFVRWNDRVGGAISGPGLVKQATPTGGNVEHYDAAKLVAFDCGKYSRVSEAYPIWIGDRELTYQAPKCAKNVRGGEQDEWRFGVDQKPIKFKLKPDLLYKIEGTDMVFSTATSLRDGWRISPSEPGCNGSHLHGNHPCSGAADPSPGGCGHGKVVKVGG